MSPSPVCAAPNTPAPLPRRSGTARRAKLLVCAAALAAATGCNALALPAPPPTQFTSFAAENLPGLGERSIGGDLSGGGLTVRATVPEIPNAGRLTERLTEILEREAADFRNAVETAERLEADWELTAAGSGLVGVRLTRTETDHRGSHDSYSTYYYDTRTGRLAYSTELLAGDTELQKLDRMAAAALTAPRSEPAALHPGFRLYDSIGFNGDGDLLVEFDAGKAAPIGAGRTTAVIAAADARPLLSDLGERALSASQRRPRAFSVDSPPDGGAADDPGIPDVPGSSHGGPDHKCGTETTCVALTFDDGPGKRTGELLDVLAEHGAPATFFLSGNAIRNRPQPVGRAWAQGHEIGSHGETHESFPELRRSELEAELAAVDALIRREIGVPVGLVRPPFGDTDESVATAAAEHGQTQVIWDTDSRDWTGISAAQITANVTSETPPNGLVLMHDGEKATVAALPRILEYFDSQGYTLVTVSDLLGRTEPGGLYYSADPAANTECIRLAGCP
ncbi:hypothetical protein GCM10027570_25990 [Streptomonospora sediminis]